MRANRSAGLLVVLAACAAPNDKPGQHQPAVDFHEFADVSNWTVTADEARAIAVGIMEREHDRYLRVKATPRIRDGQAVWHVTGTNLIAGGWEVEIDPRTGDLVSARRLPGR